MSGSLILEGVLAALLLATIGYCAMLEQRLRALKRDQTSLNGTVRAVNGAIAAARAHIAALKGSATLAVESLSTQVAQARAMADELTLLIEVGKGTAERIQESTTGIPIMPPPEDERPADSEETQDKVSAAG
ncbi:MAG: DUF6468 domain-containing protein [Alphaproteobacteria bacterium]